MTLNLVIMLSFAIHLLAFGTFLIQQGLAFKKVYGYLCEVSGLGELKNAKHRYYNFGYFMFGLLSLPFSYNLTQILEQTIAVKVAVLFLCIADLALCFIALYPRDTFPKTHVAFSIVLFAGTISALMLLVYPFYKSELIPNFVIFLNFFISLSLLTYVFIKIKNIRLFGLMDKSTEAAVSIWEWIPFMSTILWSFLLNLVVLYNLP